MLLRLGALAAWAAVGIPYGIKIYKQQVAEGKDKVSAIASGVFWGVVWPLEQLAKAVKNAWDDMLG